MSALTASSNWSGASVVSIAQFDLGGIKRLLAVARDMKALVESQGCSDMLRGKVRRARPAEGLPLWRLGATRILFAVCLPVWGRSCPSACDDLTPFPWLADPSQHILRALYAHECVVCCSHDAPGRHSATN